MRSRRESTPHGAKHWGGAMWIDLGVIFLRLEEVGENWRSRWGMSSDYVRSWNRRRRSLKRRRIGFIVRGGGRKGHRTRAMMASSRGWNRDGIRVLESVVGHCARVRCWDAVVEVRVRRRGNVRQVGERWPGLIYIYTPSFPASQCSLSHMPITSLQTLISPH